MADERDLRDDAMDEDASPELVHDDIVKRLLDYQRQLRETGPEGETPSATATITAEAIPSEEIVDLTRAEREDAETISPDEPATATDLATTDATTLETTTDPETIEALDAADDASADVIVLHPETTADATSNEAASVDETADEAIASAMGEIVAAEATAEPTMATGGAESDAMAATEDAQGLPEAPSMLADAAILDVTTVSVTEPTEDAERIARYERALEDLGARFAILRQSFQDMTIAADERLAEIEELLAQTQLDR